MKKCGLLVMCLLISSIVLSGCNVHDTKSPIKYQRKLETYLPNNTQKANTVDLSEGPKLRYDANFGPKDLNFDMKIVTPY